MRTAIVAVLIVIPIVEIFVIGTDMNPTIKIVILRQINSIKNLKKPLMKKRLQIKTQMGINRLTIRTKKRYQKELLRRNETRIETKRETKRETEIETGTEIETEIESGTENEKESEIEIDSEIGTEKEIERGTDLEIEKEIGTDTDREIDIEGIIVKKEGTVKEEPLLLIHHQAQDPEKPVLNLNHL